MGYSFRLAARVILYASSHRQDNTYHGLCYTSRGALAGTRNSSMGPPHEGSIRRPIAPWANALTTELHLAPQWRWRLTKSSLSFFITGVRCGIRTGLWHFSRNSLFETVQERIAASFKHKITGTFLHELFGGLSWTTRPFPALNLTTAQGARCSSVVRAFVHCAMGRRIDPSWGGSIGPFSFQPVLHDWCNKDRGMCYPVCGMVHIKEPLLLIGKSSPCGGSGFPLFLYEWLFTICLTPYNRK